MKKQIYKFLSLLLLALFIHFNHGYSADYSIQPTAVIGFNNLGDPSDDHINIIITKSLIRFLSKIPQAVITPYEAVESTAVKNGYWKRKSMDKDIAASMAQGFDSKQYVVGEYKKDRKANTIELKVYVYNVVTGDIKLSRTYQGSAGIDLFDTIENMTKNISGLLAGKRLEFGKLSIRITGSMNVYMLTVNGKDEGLLSERKAFSDVFPADENIEVVLRQTNNGQEVYRETKPVQKNRTAEVVYSPMGDILVKNSIEEGVLFLDGVEVKKIGKGRSMTLNHIRAGGNHQIQLKMRDRTVRNDVSVEEGETSIALFESQGNIVRIDYKPSIVWMNLAIPGFAQFQANDSGIGSLFLVAGVSGQILFIVSEIGFNDSFNKYLNAASSNDIANYYGVSETWRNLSIAGISLWSASAVFSIIHALIQQNRQFSALGDGIFLDVAYHRDDINIYFSGRF